MHVLGSFNTTRAAWPRMVEQGYGRIVMTTSSGMFGLPTNLAYATAKAGVIGLTRSLATAGAHHGIKINVIAPAAMTRMAGREPVDEPGAAPMAPDLVAPMVAFLAHERCPGERRGVRGRRRPLRPHLHRPDRGVPRRRPARPTVEDVAQHWAEINDERGYSVPADLMGWSAAFLAHQT